MMAAYDGMDNSKDYVINYKTFLELQTQVFLTTLLGVAQAQFYNLEAKGIKTFIDLANAFI